MATYCYSQINVIEYSSPFKSLEIISYPSKKLSFLIKRTIDFCGALLALILLFPVFVFIIILIKSNSKGPVFFKQKRVGYKGTIFTFLKFRTMYPDCDDKIHREYVVKLINGNIKETNLGKNRPLFKLTCDHRVTRVGKFLRSWSLDELPQLINVLKGEMSLVGPRPAIPYEVENYSAWHLQRLDTMPGITGLWQVKGRSRTTFDEMVRLDIQYIKKWSLLLDFKILIRTLPAVFSREGAL